ncbi:DNA-binding protein [Salmonella enterica subsp. enterica serovar Derby]|uniref:DNA-binding protein n=1 Tax=Salmonella derby TaxID=28144 RepID=A0A5W7Z755_SALDE|nr:helix-turn-helix domain-containing protein [Salmonella enterica]EDU1642567.1 DNA-binding protein [Salmonella enterica subsp. enterica serovar Saintpaul]EDV1146209.1 DNA-binding protein [Salmonella enterica subsp. enterica]EDV5163637.1 DNA-binding protein [Salmonella enterica subsp. enterica serovar Hato]EED5956325.1 DNA-binding protein [Salmonella enterica subsp. enterica serovar Agona]EHJ5082083.1 helix-turn-helix domain-containing protein [Salmonella enterica subsp. enterica serovar 47:z4
MNRKEVPGHDWPSEIIKARLHMAGLSFRSLSIEAGYSKDSLKSVLRTPCRPYQQIIADALGVSPEEIWPSRYQAKSYIRKAS